MRVAVGTIQTAKFVDGPSDVISQTGTKASADDPIR